MQLKRERHRARRAQAHGNGLARDVQRQRDKDVGGLLTIEKQAAGVINRRGGVARRREAAGDVGARLRQETSSLATARASAYREQLQGIYAEADWGSARSALDRWYQGAVRCRLAPVKRVAKTIREHAYGVLRLFDSGVTNGILEGFSSLVQAEKARARGYRNPQDMRLVVHLLLSKLDFELPAVLRSTLPT